MPWVAGSATLLVSPGIIEGDYGVYMIEVTKLNGEKIDINSDLVEIIEETPDTVLTFSSGKKIIVKESRQEVRNLVILYKQACYMPPHGE